MLKVSSLRAIIVLIIDMYMTCILYYMDISRRAVQGGCNRETVAGRTVRFHGPSPWDRPRSGLRVFTATWPGAAQPEKMKKQLEDGKYISFEAPRKFS